MSLEDGSDKKEGSLSISDVVHLQDSLKKEIDFSKPDSELTPEEFAKKAIYLAMDDAVEEKLGKEQKQGIDEARNKIEALSKFQENLQKMVELGREIEKNFIWQQAYLINHFDKSKDNQFRLVVDGMTTDMISAEKKMSANERVEFAKTLLEVVAAYRGEVVKELVSKQEIISALLPALEKNLNATDFDLFAQEVGDKQSADAMKNSFQEWLRLSKELIKSRKMTIDAVEEHLDMDDLLPKYVIQNDGDISKKLSGVELNTKGERFARLINESDRLEKEIEEKRSKLSEELFGKVDDYMKFPKEGEQKQQEQKFTPHPLQDKAWFRLAKVLYVAAICVAILINLAIFTVDATIGFWMAVVIVVLFTLIRKAFYYVVIGKTSL